MSLFCPKKYKNTPEIHKRKKRKKKEKKKENLTHCVVVG
jgi:hypothetical protein